MLTAHCMLTDFMTQLCISPRSDVPWTGPTCGRLLTAPAKPGGVYGFSPNISSWGGSLVTDASGMHHLFAAQIPGGLTRWGTSSECIHATSADLEGPFKLKDIAVKPWCHGPQVVMDPDGITLEVGPGDVRAEADLCLDPSGDHRMAFTFALLGLGLEGVTVSDPSVVAKSWPAFRNALLTN